MTKLGVDGAATGKGFNCAHCALSCFLTWETDRPPLWPAVDKCLDCAARERVEQRTQKPTDGK